MLRRLIVLFPGDVSLSAEDKPPSSPSPATYRVLTPVSHSGLATSLEPDDEGVDEEYDYFDEDQVEEEGRHQLHEGHTALKFLLAGGAAGAGELTHLFLHRYLTRESYSFAIVYCPIRPTQNLPHHAASRTRRHEGIRCQGHGPCHYAYLLRRRSSCILDGKWSFCSQDFS